MSQEPKLIALSCNALPLTNHTDGSATLFQTIYTGTPNPTTRALTTADEL